MPNRTDAQPVLITGDAVVELERLPVDKNELGECKDLRDFVFEHPACLPVRQIDPNYAPLLPIGIEVDTGAGPIDCLFIAPNGSITIVETKLWRNPEARREVVGQILDYAKEVARWTYPELDNVCRVKNKRSLWDLVQSIPGSSANDEREFVDRTSKYLREGRFLLLVVGDGIREDIEAMAAYLQGAPQLLFSLHLVELQFYQFPDGSRLVVPQLLARTKEVIRAIMHVRVGDGLNVSVDVDVPSDASMLPNPSSRNRLSEAEFLTSFEEALPQYASFVQRVMDDVAGDERLAIEWHANSFSIKLRDPLNPRNLFSVLNVDLSGKVQVWSLKEQFVRSGIPAELADTYISSVGSALATTAINAALKPPGTISQLSKNYYQIKTLITDLVDSVYRTRQRV